jgi:hypothetical protein
LRPSSTAGCAEKNEIKSNAGVDVCVVIFQDGDISRRGGFIDSVVRSLGGILSMKDVPIKARFIIEIEWGIWFCEK